MNADPQLRPADPARSTAAPRGRLSVLRQLLLVVVAAALGVGVYAGYRHFTTAGEGAGAAPSALDAAVPVVLAAAEQREALRRVEAVGTTFSRRAIQVVPLTSGRVVEVAFEAGQAVAAGDVLARLDDDIERADLAEAEATLRETVLALERAQALRKKGAVPEATVEQLVASRAGAQADLDRAHRRLADRTVRAAFDGVVGLRQIDPGARVDENTVITTLDDRSEMEIEFSLPEGLYGEVAIGQPVVATSTAFPDRRFDGAVATIDSRVDAVSRSFKVRALLPNPDLALPAGMFMHVSVVLDSRIALMIPEEAVVVQGSRTYVYVAAGGKASVRNVQLGLREVGAVEITDGLAPGEMVVIRGTQRLRDGMPVRVLQEHDEPLARGTDAAPA